MPVDYLGNISNKRLFFENIWKTYLIASIPQLSFKYFINLWLIFKLFSKVSQIQVSKVKEILKHEWVNPWTQNKDFDIVYIHVHSFMKI